MPRALWALSPDEMEIRDYDMPEPAAGQALVRTEYAAAKHGTEMSATKGYGSARGRVDSDLRVFVPGESGGAAGPVKVGNMYVGTVTQVGPDVHEVSEGERVLAFGGFQDVHVLHTAGKFWKVPQGMSWKSAVCMDPADFAVAAIRDGQVRIGDAVAVFGMGAIGLMVVQVARLSGASPVIAVDPLQNRRQAAEACGAHLTIDPTSCDAGVEIKKATGNRGVDVAVEYSGSVHAMQAALRGVAFGGNVVAGAFPPPYGAGLDLGAEAHYNRPNIIFTRAHSEPNREHPRWDELRIYSTCWRLLCEGQLTGESVVDPVVPFEDLVTEYPKIANNPGTNIKLGAKF